MSGSTVQQGLLWDIDDTITRECTLATAAATSDSVILSFGVQDADDEQVLAVRPRLVRRIALRPASAKHLRDMLSQAMQEPATGPTNA
jgi:hypothetical protein